MKRIKTLWTQWMLPQSRTYQQPQQQQTDSHSNTKKSTIFFVYDALNGTIHDLPAVPFLSPSPENRVQGDWREIHNN
jgi:hypothetical protein